MIARTDALAGPHVYDSLLDLARLPWFEEERGRLVVSDREEVGSIIDVHAHLALAYVRPMQVDLFCASGETEHYLPACCRVDLDVYVNKNFTQEHLRALNDDLIKGSMRRGGMRASHTVPNLAREMDELGVVKSIILPIDFPFISENHAHAADAAKRDDHIMAFGSVHPYTPKAHERLDEQAHQGALGVKVHPNVQCVRPDDPKARALYRACGERNLPILIHCGPVGIEPALGRWLTQVKWYERGIAENPKTTFILGHSGALQFDEALALQKKYPNVWLETSSQSLTNVRAMVERADPDRVAFGSDWPFYHQAIPLAKVLIATEGKPALRQKILFANAARMLGLA
ncbi:MAG: amidohydrolase family protein [Deltaproteobacteria bacterium]|nr:amidohydrolase family protein [Deltaproteobacteria bacterium]